MKLLKSKKGFTLLELLIVLVILGIIAGLAIPVITGQINRNKGQEALRSLEVVKQKQIEYFVLNNAYAGTFALLGYDPGAAAAGQTPIFTYTLASASANVFSCVATLTAGAGGTTSDTYTLTQTGKAVGAGIFL